MFSMNHMCISEIPRTVLRSEGCSEAKQKKKTGKRVEERLWTSLVAQFEEYKERQLGGMTVAKKSKFSLDRKKAEIKEDECRGRLGAN